MRLWVFSDLHLEVGSFYQEFLNLLRTDPQSGDRVVFNGDIFDLFVGSSEHFVAPFRSFVTLMTDLTQRGVQVDYLHGNHDFHLERAFAETGVYFHEDSLEMILSAPQGTKRIWIEHGDLVDQSDWKYQNLRKIFRSRTLKVSVPHLPTAVILGLAKLLSRKADQQISELPESWPETDRNRLRALFRAHAEQKHRQGYDYVVMGHCHDLDEVEPYYFNMGYPPVHRQYLHYDSSTGCLERRKFPGISAKN
jgi:UDP-2,3-diacylglucosamine pyrophosphatase LpxH